MGVNPAYIGKVFPEIQFTIERSKLDEFLLATGDDNPDYEDDDPPLPPTFPTLFSLWGYGGLPKVLRQIDIGIHQVLHVEQEYEVLGSVRIGDTVKGFMTVKDIYQRRGNDMTFIAFETEYRNQADRVVLLDRSLLLVRE